MTRVKTEGLIKDVPFSLKPDADARKVLAEELGILGIRKLTFSGQVSPTRVRDLSLTAELGATVVQPCVVTLEPVVSRIDAHVFRQYLADPPIVSDAEETDMHEDESIEALGETIDLNAVMAEALSLELPEWPRADGVEPVEIAVTEPGKKPMTDEEAKPFAQLASLREKLEKKGE